MATITRSSSSKNSERLNCRISPAVKQRAEQAARSLGQSITAFTESALAEKAQSVLAEQERMVLSQRDFARFAEILNDPAPPTPALKRAMSAYRKAKKKHSDRGL